MRKWPVFNLGALVKLRHGYAFDSAGFCAAGEYALLTPKNFFEEGGFRQLDTGQKFYCGEVSAKWVLKPGSLVVAMTEQAPGLLGACVRIPAHGKWLHNQRMGLIEFTQPKKLAKQYLYHWFNWQPIRQAIFIAASGTKVRHSSPTQIEALEIALPSLEEQHQAAFILDLWDAKINLLSDMLDTLQLRKQGLMKQMLSGRKRIKGLKQKWKTYKLADLAQSSSDKNTSDDDLPVLSCTKHSGLVDSLAYFGKQIFSENTAAYKLVKRGQFAYATNHIEEGSIGYQDLYDSALISPMYTVFEADNSRVDDLYLYRLLKTEKMRRAFEKATHASVARRGSLRWSEFSKLKIEIPPLAEQVAITKILDSASLEINLVTNQLEQLKSQKRALMKKLLSGPWQKPSAARKGGK